MNISRVATRQEWLGARLDLLAKEKAASRQLAALAEQRRALPAVPVEKDYVFDGTTDPFAECGAHQEFHRELQQRLAAPPIVNRAVLIGSYFGSRCCDV